LSESGFAGFKDGRTKAEIRLATNSRLIKRQNTVATNFMNEYRIKALTVNCLNLDLPDLRMGRIKAEIRLPPMHR